MPKQCLFAEVVFADLMSGILEYKLLHVYFGVTEKFDGTSKITEATLLARGWKCVCHISVLLEVAMMSCHWLSPFGIRKQPA